MKRVNQSKLEANTCSRSKARESVCKRVTIGFGFTSDLIGKGKVDFILSGWPIQQRG